MLQHSELKDFCESFYGYGDASASKWFVSMEEGGGNTEDEIQTRVSSWIARGRRELEDAQAYHRLIGLGHWFDLRPKIQKTWAASIRMLLVLEGRPTDRESVRAFQRGRLGGINSGHRLTPLFPLPSKSLDHWNYGEWTESPELRSRQMYRSNFEALRKSRIAEAIAATGPKSVVFYGTSYRAYWSSIANTIFQVNPDGYEIGQRDGTYYVICKHPAVQGVSQNTKGSGLLI